MGPLENGQIEVRSMEIILRDYRESVMINSWLFVVSECVTKAAEVIFAVIPNSSVTVVTNTNIEKIKN